MAVAAPGEAAFTYERGIQLAAPVAGERFGAVLVRVGLGNTVLVGTQPGPTTRAKVYRYNVLTGAPVATYLSPTVGGGDRFGTAMAVVGSAVFIGSPGWNGGRGAVHQFDVATGAFVQSILNDALTPNAAEFGTAVAAMNQFLLVGAPRAPHSSGLSPVGRVFVFDLTAADPLVPVRACEPALPALGAEFGHALAPIGAHVAIGAPGYTSGASDGFVFLMDALAGPFTNPCATLWSRTVEMAGARFGEAVENVIGLIVGGAPGVGEVRAYDPSGALEYARDVGTTTWGHGRSLGTLGSNLLAGIPTAPSPGVIVYSAVGGLVESNHLPLPGTEYGAAVEAVDHRVVIGSPGINAAAGMIHVLRWACGDGTVGTGETCDDGNVVSGDCCSSTCQTDADGTGCTTGNLCELGTCAGGACQGECMEGVACSPLCATLTCRIDPGTGACGCVEATTTTSTTTTTITTTTTSTLPNTPPVAVVPMALTVRSGEAFFLDGTQSFDPDGGPLTFAWTLQAPGGSMAAFDDPGSPTPSLTPDVMGAYTVQLIVHDGTDPSEVATLALTATDTSPITLTIDEPAPEASVPAAVLVRGTVTVSGGSGNVGVTVDGLGAGVQGTTYAVAPVPVRQGPSVLTATATTATGDRLSVSRLVDGTGQEPLLRVTADPPGGPAPLAVTFKHVLASGEVIQSFDLDFGDGSNTTDPSPPIVHEYQTPGVFIATLSIVAGGVAFEASAVIEVLDQAAMDQMFTGMWGALKTRLSNVDVVGASALIAQRARDDYADAWSLLGGNLPGIVASFASFERMRIAGDHAHYVVTRSVDGQPYAFLVTFVRDGDGMWRISDM